LGGDNKRENFLYSSDCGEPIQKERQLQVGRRGRVRRKIRKKNNSRLGAVGGRIEADVKADQEPRPLWPGREKV